VSDPCDCDEDCAQEDVQVGVQVFQDQHVESVQKEQKGQRYQCGEMGGIFHRGSSTLGMVDKTSSCDELCREVRTLFIYLFFYTLYYLRPRTHTQSTTISKERGSICICTKFT